MTLLITSEPRFELGEVFATAGAFAGYSQGVLLECLNRHAAGDWGDLDEEDLAANEAALLSGSRLFSSYLLAGGGKLWVITEHDRSATTVFLPEEY